MRSAAGRLDSDSGLPRRRQAPGHPAGRSRGARQPEPPQPHPRAQGARRTCGVSLPAGLGEGRTGPPRGRGGRGPRIWGPAAGAGAVRKLWVGEGLREPATTERVRNRAPLGRGPSGDRGSLRTTPSGPHPFPEPSTARGSVRPGHGGAAGGPRAAAGLPEGPSAARPRVPATPGAHARPWDLADSWGSLKTPAPDPTPNQ